MGRGAYKVAVTHMDGLLTKYTFSGNSLSIALHAAMGKTLSGTIMTCGNSFWISVLLQIIATNV